MGILGECRYILTRERERERERAEEIQAPRLYIHAYDLRLLV